MRGRSLRFIGAVALAVTAIVGISDAAPSGAGATNGVLVREGAPVSPAEFPWGCEAAPRGCPLPAWRNRSSDQPSRFRS